MHKHASIRMHLWIWPFRDTNVSFEIFHSIQHLSWGENISASKSLPILCEYSIHLSFEYQNRIHAFASVNLRQGDFCLYSNFLFEFEFLFPIFSENFSSPSVVSELRLSPRRKKCHRRKKMWHYCDCLWMGVRVAVRKVYVAIANFCIPKISNMGKNQWLGPCANRVSFAIFENGNNLDIVVSSRWTIVERLRFALNCIR